MGHRIPNLLRLMARQRGAEKSLRLGACVAEATQRKIRPRNSAEGGGEAGGGEGGGVEFSRTLGASFKGMTSWVAASGLLP